MEWERIVMLRIRQLLKAASIYCENETRRIDIDEHIKIRYFKPNWEDYCSIHIYIDDIEVLFVSDRGLFGITVYKIYRIPRGAKNQINSWSSDIMRAKGHIISTRKRKARKSKRENKEKLKNLYKN